MRASSLLFYQAATSKQTADCRKLISYYKLATPN